MQLLKSDPNPYSKVFLVKGKEGNPASRTASKMSSRFFSVISVSFLASFVWLALSRFAFVFSVSCSFVTRSLVFFFVRYLMFSTGNIFWTFSLVSLWPCVPESLNYAFVRFLLLFVFSSPHFSISFSATNVFSIIFGSVALSSFLNPMCCNYLSQ